MYKTSRQGSHAEPDCIAGAQHEGGHLHWLCLTPYEPMEVQASSHGPCMAVIVVDWQQIVHAPGQGLATVWLQVTRG